MTDDLDKDDALKGAIYDFLATHLSVETVRDYYGAKSYELRLATPTHLRAPSSSREQYVVIGTVDLPPPER